MEQSGQHPRGLPPNRAARAQGLKAKDLVEIPWRVALALQQDGWWLRNAIVWAKPNGTPVRSARPPGLPARVRVPARPLEALPVLP